MAAKIINGPVGVKLHLDPEQFYPDDPGAGAPALVEYRGEFGSYHCVTAEGEIGDGLRLPRTALKWLESPTIEELVEEVYS